MHWTSHYGTGIVFTGNILKHFKNATLDLMPISSRRRRLIIPVYDNEMDKSGQLACIRYKTQNVSA